VSDLVIDGLSVSVRGPTGRLRVTDGVELIARGGRATALVGESGSGKTLTALALLRLLPDGAAIDAGRVLLRRSTASGDDDVVDLAALDDAGLRRVRGRRVAMVFQEPMTALNPLMRVVDQVGEAIVIHERVGRKAARARATALLERVGVPETRSLAYPHELSGGQRQRVMIAAALAADPEVVIADEPTTALDVTVQAQVLALLRSLVDERQMALLLITHDLGVVAEACDDVCVLYAGRVVERGTVDEVFRGPRHPYTRGLLRSMPATAPRGQPLPAIRGQIPPVAQWPSGCRFRDRCDEAIDICRTDPPVVTIGSEHTVRCARVGS
jgi:peptide/nickel transport system ATP-binding protein